MLLGNMAQNWTWIVVMSPIQYVMNVNCATALILPNPRLTDGSHVTAVTGTSTGTVWESNQKRLFQTTISVKGVFVVSIYIYRYLYQWRPVLCIITLSNLVATSNRELMGWQGSSVSARC